MGIHRQQLHNTGSDFPETATQTQRYLRVHIYGYVKQDHSPQVLEHARQHTGTPWLMQQLHSVRYSTSPILHNTEFSTHMVKYVCIQMGGPVEIQTPKHQSLISHSTTAPLLVLSPSSTLLPHVSALPLPKEKSFFFYFFKNHIYLKLHTSGNVCMAKSRTQTKRKYLPKCL